MVINKEENEKLKKEKEFFDRIYEEMDEAHRRQNYIVPRELIEQIIRPNPMPVTDREYVGSIMPELKGKKVLDYGAGDGWNTICFAKGDAEVWAIDISDKAIELIKKKARKNSVEFAVKAEVRNCYETGFENNMFDIIYGGGILHHLDMDLAGRELGRILKSSGIAIFREPYRETKMMDVVKRIILLFIKKRVSETTEKEAPLKGNKIKKLKNYFECVSLEYFDALSSLNLFIHSQKIKKLLGKVDQLLIRKVPGFAKLCRTVIIELREPIKKKVATDKIFSNIA
jgi:2-polyprenyl-3-methyl-5-hydroxy-6-metoxy-1,4-benzoquinol methylase